MKKIYVDFVNKKVCSESDSEWINEKHLIDKKYNRVYKLDELITNRLSIKQLDLYNRKTKFIDRAKSLKKISKSKKLNAFANEMIDILNEVHSLKNSTEIIPF